MTLVTKPGFPSKKIVINDAHFETCCDFAFMASAATVIAAQEPAPTFRRSNL